MITFFCVLFSLLAIWVFFRNRPALPVLMYHKVDPHRQDGLTVSVEQLERQLDWLKANNYQAVTIKQVINAVDHRQRLPARSVLLTFDDAYQNNLIYAVPLLQRLGFRAVLFVPTAYIGGYNDWDDMREKILDAEQLRDLPPEIELALHSHRHANYKTLSSNEIRVDLQQNLAMFQALNISFSPAFAYPYGGRPIDSKTKRAMWVMMQELGIRLAFRIGNRLNLFPLRNRYELQRLDIRGTDSLATFARKIRWGKLG